MRHSLKFKFTNITLEEIRIMEREKLSGFITRLYITIKSFAHGKKTSCFPSYRTIAEAMGSVSKHFKAQINKGINKLVEVGLIIKNEVDSKDRFVLRMKNEVEVSTKVKSSTSQGSQNELPVSSQNELPNRRKRKLKPIYVSNERSPDTHQSKIEETYNKDSVEKWLFGFFSEKKVLEWSVDLLEQATNKWREEANQPTLSLLSKINGGKEPGVIIESKIRELKTAQRRHIANG